MKDSEKQERAINWLKEKTKSGELHFKTMIELFDVLMQNIEAMTISDYAKKNGITYNGTLSRIDSGNLNALNFHGNIFVFETKKKEIPEYMS